jgi:[ribosomal protein S5]-alanine N-acetyltransferase
VPNEKSVEFTMLHVPPDDILTPRLALIVISPTMLEAEKANNNSLGLLIRSSLPADWPPPHWEPHVFTFLLDQYERFPELIAWNRYVAFLNPDGTRTLIGTLGAFQREGSPRECETGYSILPQYQGQGLATEAALALIEFIRKDLRITSVIAHTDPSLPASIRVMEKCGFVIDGEGEEAGTVRYRLRL